MEAKFEISIAAYTSIVSENAKLKAILNGCRFILKKAAEDQVRMNELSNLKAAECEEALKRSDEYLIQRYSFDSSIQILLDKVPCFSVMEIRNALAQSIRSELHIFLESMKMYEKFSGKTEDAG